MAKARIIVPDEHAEQAALCAWWRLYSQAAGLEENLLFAIPNGGRRDAITGARLKAEGVRAGVPDMFLAWPSKTWQGLFVELKRQRGGQVSRPQKAMMETLKKAGYAVTVCRGWDEARAAIEKYLGENHD